VDGKHRSHRPADTRWPQNSRRAYLRGKVLTLQLALSGALDVAAVRRISRNCSFAGSCLVASAVTNAARAFFSSGMRAGSTAGQVIQPRADLDHIVGHEVGLAHRAASPGRPASHQHSLQVASCQRPLSHVFFATRSPHRVSLFHPGYALRNCSTWVALAS